jgi:hypothetical protein
MICMLAAWPTTVLAVDEPANLLTVAEQLGYPADAKLLIIHADDAGMSHSANVGTIRSMTEGSVNSASIMVPCPWFNEIVDYFRKHPEMDFGLHLTLTAEWQTYRWHSVTSPDRLPGLHDPEGFLWREVAQVAGHATSVDVETELRAQVQRAFDFGIKPTHVDTHMGAVFANPMFFQAYRKVALEFDLPYLMPKITPELRNRLGPAWRVVAKSIEQTLSASGEITLDHLIQISGSHDADSQREFYLDALRNLEPGITQIIIHCGMYDDELRAITNSAERRDLDRQIFSSPEVKKLIETQGVQMITWREIGERQRKLRATLRK